MFFVSFYFVEMGVFVFCLEVLVISVYVNQVGLVLGNSRVVQLVYFFIQLVYFFIQLCVIQGIWEF